MGYHGSGSAVAATIVDGGDVNAGATTDAAITTDTTGTLSGKLRGLVKWAFERMPAALGQGTMAASLPVVVASNQSAVAVSGTITANPATAFSKTITYVSISQGGAGTTELAAASVGNKHKVMGMTIVMDAAGTAQLSDGTAVLTGAKSIVASGGWVWPTSALPYTETVATNRPLQLITVTAAAKGVIAILTEA